jgi:hypothetical protein
VQNTAVGTPLLIYEQEILMKRIVWSMLCIAPFLAASLHAQEPEKAASNMEILRDKLKADKKLVVAANMQLTESEAKAFWPVYDTYQKDLQAINDRTGKLITAYADAWNKGPVTDEAASKLVEEALAIEDAELALKRSYLPKLNKALPAAKVGRYMQIENKIRAAVKYELAGAIPLAE